MSVAQKMAEDELSSYSASSHGMSLAEPYNKPPFSAITMPLWHLGAGGQTWCI
jgi:hypothetical protein